MKRAIAFAGLTIAFVAVLASEPADAHFILQAPASWKSQDMLGDPQKLGPCGDEDGGSPTNIVSAFQTGQTITVLINETVFHPGHYRISIAPDRTQLPAEPIVTPGMNTPCGTVPIQNPAVFPVLADGVFPHTKALNGPQWIQVKLPPNFTCKKCTLQVLEFMSNHPLNNPGGCFYHHCADFSISDTPPDGGFTDAEPPPPMPDASTNDAAIDEDASTILDASIKDAAPMGDASTMNPPMPSSGCSCNASGRSPIALAGLVFVAFGLWRRRRTR